MRIGIDVRKYDDFGIGTYIQNLVRELAGRGGHEFVLFAAENHLDAFRTLSSCTVIPERSPKYSLRELTVLSRNANRQRLDLFHSPHYTLPFGLSSKSIVTIHDIIHLRMTDQFSLVQKMYASAMVRHACSASAIIVDSAFTKTDLLSRLRVDEGKVTVVPLGVHSSFSEHVPEPVLREFRERRGITRPYILYTGGLKKHKNVDVLLRAFQLVRTVHDISLVFTGEEIGGHLVELMEELKIRDAVLGLGRLPHDDLVAAYQGSLAVVLPSRYEGFGFSMLEAMASGVPALGARTTSIPEVLGDAGILFEPQDHEELAHGLQRILEDTALRDDYIQRGKRRARMFTWEACAQKTLEVYEAVG